jgi:hypothetical protein
MRLFYDSQSSLGPEVSHNGYGNGRVSRIFESQPASDLRQQDLQITRAVRCISIFVEDRACKSKTAEYVMAFRRFRNTRLRNRTECTEGLYKHWMGLADMSMSGLYDQIKEDVPFRRLWAEKCRFGFELPEVAPNVPKTRRETERRLSLLDCVRKNGRGERI